MYNFLPQEKFISLYNVNELFSENLANIFCLSISLHLSFHSCCFLYTNANPILCSSSFTSTAELCTPILHFCYS
jgi:hypothetical protein